MPQLNPHTIQILLIVLFFLLSGLGWLFRKLKEQAELKRIQTERERRVEHMLRTGRDPEGEMHAGPAPLPGTAIDTQRRLQEVAERRRAQLQELRERQLQRRQQPQETPGSQPEMMEPPPIILMGPSGPIAIPRRPVRPPHSPPTHSFPPPPGRGFPPAPRPGQRPVPIPGQGRRPGTDIPDGRGRPLPPPAPKPTQGRRRPADGMAPARPPARPGRKKPSQAAPPSQFDAAAEADTVQRLVPDAPPIETARRGPDGAPGRVRGVGLPKVSPASTGEWQRLIAMMEVLGPPVALREGQQNTPARPMF